MRYALAISQERRLLLVAHPRRVLQKQRNTETINHRPDAITKFHAKFVERFVRRRYCDCFPPTRIHFHADVVALIRSLPISGSSRYKLPSSWRACLSRIRRLVTSRSRKTRTESYVKCVDMTIGGRGDGERRGTRHRARRETVIRDAKGGMARPRCMIITCEESPTRWRGSTSRGLPKRLQDVRRREDSSRAWPETLSTLTSNKN